MLDIKFILANKNLVEQNCRNRGVRVDFNLIKKLSQQRLHILREIEGIRAELNQIAARIKNKEQIQREGTIKKTKDMKAELKEKEAALRTAETKLKEELYKIPNLTHPEAPVGFTDKNNAEVKRVGVIRDFDFHPKDHLELGKILGILDFEAGTQTTGNKFYFLKGDGALLELSLVLYVFELLTKKGFQFYLSPDLARMSIIEGIGYIPRGPETQIYKIEGGDLGLIATAEITLGGLYQNKTINASELPIKLAGYSHCFRTEAGAYGKASKGLYRVHQFTKVEMFIFSLPEQSNEMLNYLVEIETEIFQGLDIPFRIVDCCTGDLGGSAYRKFDLEAWMPAERKWGEITSASNCTDYQARRLGVKLKQKDRQGKTFVHTLNGTGIATSRAIIAILENFQEPDGSVVIPEVLRKWMGKTRIAPSN